MSQHGEAISKFDNLIDSRDVIKRVDELETDLTASFEDWQGEDDERLAFPFAEWLEAQATAGNDDAAELIALRNLADQGEGYAGDWRHGATLIHDSYFERYAQELAEDIGAIDANAAWPNSCIDWEQAARELQSDYTAIDFDGETYWVR